MITTANLKQRIEVERLGEYAWGRYDQGLYAGRFGYVKDEKMEGRVTVFFSGKTIFYYVA